MNPIYKFDLVVALNGATANYSINPIWDTGAEKVYELEQNQKFFRAKFNGKLLFVRNDFDLINNADFESQFVITISISFDNGATWAEYWKGDFYKTDCAFDLDNRTIEVKPNVLDDYSAVLAGMDKEYNLIGLTPEITPITINKRPLIQMYVPGESVVSCFLSGMYWEQDCDAVTDETELVNTYHFSLNNSQLIYEISGAVELSMMGSESHGYTFGIYSEPGPTGETWYAELSRISDGARWVYEAGQVQPSLPLTLQAVSGTPATGTVDVSQRTLKVYARYLLDVEQISGVNTYPLPYNDMVGNNRNYKRAIGYGVSNVVVFSTNTSTTPTEWGIIQPGIYYREPYSIYGSKYYPIGRSHWSWVSIWFTFSAVDWLLEERGRKEYILKDANPLSSVISVLLAQIAPEITHEPTTDYSQFLYGSRNPISGDAFKLFITQKSNVLAGDYTQPAQKAPITLKMVTDMLRDVYCCYWYIENKKFHVEHISFFKNGGSYTGTPEISHDLTTEIMTRNNKPIAYRTSQYEYNKQTMPERLQFGWMDDVTQAFNGEPIEIVSRYVEQGNIEEINVSNFTSDIDYMLLNPGACSKDGFALMAAVETGGVYKLPFVTREVGGVDYVNQNGLLAFFDLQPKYYVYDLPSRNIKINNEPFVAYGITRDKTQKIRFTTLQDPEPNELIKTFLGNGQIEKISINLSSREANATLVYDTQN